MGDCTDTVLVIPSEYNGCPVIGFTNKCFAGNTDIVEVHIPKSVEWLSGAFAGCTNLKKLYINGLSTLYANSFSGLTSLEYVRYPSLKALGAGCFTGCSGATFDFSGCASVPTFDSRGYGEEFGANPTIIVPAALYDEWVEDTNWALYAEHIRTAN